MTAGGARTLIRGARVFDGQRLREAGSVRDIAAIWRNGARLHREP